MVRQILSLVVFISLCGTGCAGGPETVSDSAQPLTSDVEFVFAGPYDPSLCPSWTSTDQYGRPVAGVVGESQFETLSYGTPGDAPLEECLKAHLPKDAELRRLVRLSCEDGSHAVGLITEVGSDRVAYFFSNDLDLSSSLLTDGLANQPCSFSAYCPNIELSLNDFCPNID